MTEQPNPNRKELRIEFRIPDSVTAQRSDYAIVQRKSPSEYTLMFFDMRLPLIISDAPGAREKFEALEAMEAFCVGRISLGRDELERLVAAIQKQLALGGLENESK